MPSSKTWSSKQPKVPIGLYRVIGKSMLPSLQPERIVIAIHYFRLLSPEDVVVIRHDGLDKIKRIQKIRDGKVYVVGDNHRASLDSRSFGWLPVENVVAKVIWPRL